MYLYIEETMVNATDHYSLGVSGVYETSFTTRSALFARLQKQYGRCVGKVYVDTAKERAKAVGWIFSKKEHYVDSSKMYMQEMRVTVHTKKPTVETTYHYA